MVAPVTVRFRAVPRTWAFTSFSTLRRAGGRSYKAAGFGTAQAASQLFQLCLISRTVCPPTFHPCAWTSAARTMPYVPTQTRREEGLAMRFRAVMLGLIGLLGCTSESLADPIDLSGLRRASDAVSLQNLLNQELPPRRLAIETLDDIAVSDANVSISESELTGNALHFPSLIAQPIALAKWWLEGTGSGATRLSKHDRDKFTPKKPKDKCEGGPCPTTVPEPATAMLLIIGMGLASVAAHYRFRL